MPVHKLQKRASERGRELRVSGNTAAETRGITAVARLQGNDGQKRTRATRLPRRGQHSLWPANSMLSAEVARPLSVRVSRWLPGPLCADGFGSDEFVVFAGRAIGRQGFGSSALLEKV